MTIEKGSAYGTPGALAPGGVVVASDAALRAVVTEARRAGRQPPPVGLLGGDLCRTLGGPGDEERLHTSAAVTFPVDVVSVLLDGHPHWFVSHLVARHRFWRGRAVVVMNAEWLGDLDLGPRGHPGDGLVDITDGSLPLRQRLSARRRARTGSHLPHPAMRTTRRAEADLSFDPPLPVALDGEAVGPVSQVALRVEPDALTVVV